MWVVAVIIRPVDPYVYKLLLDTCEQGLGVGCSSDYKAGRSV